MKKRVGAGEARQEEGGKPRTPRWKAFIQNILLAVAAPCVFLLLAELVLWLCGVRPVSYEEDPYVGFSSYAPLFVEKTLADGTTEMVTAPNKLGLFNEQEFPAEKPGNSYRIFCMGGSTTHGRPYDDTTSFCGWLRAMLPACDPGRAWELINAGGISYASYRVAMLMEELNHYEPNLYVVYTGHNEFLEWRTYEPLRETPGLVRDLSTLVARTRTGTLMKRFITRGPGSKPKANSSTKEKRALLPEEVTPMLDQSIGPSEYHRDDEWHRQVLAHYRYNLNRMVDIARSAGAEIILVTPPSNLGDCAPFKSELKDGLGTAEAEQFQARYDQAEKMYAQGRWEESLGLVDEALAIDDGYAHAQYLRGRNLSALGRYDEARAAFIRARDEDICPLRAVSAMRDLVLEVARERGVPCIDFVGQVEERAPHGIPGADQFLDHVHPTIEENRQLALALVGELTAQGVVHPSETWGEKAIEEIKQQVEGSLDERAHAIALRNLAKVLGWAGKWEEAGKLAERAAQMAPDDAESYLNEGLTAASMGDLEKAIPLYQKALELDPYLHRAYYSLGNALHQKGRDEDAVESYERALLIAPDHAEIHNDLGAALSELGELEDAEQHYRAALHYEPDSEQASRNLAGLLAKKGEWEAAVRQFKETLQKHPDSAKAWAGLGDAFRGLERPDDAAGAYQQALAKDPETVPALQGLGMVFAMKDRPQEALEYLIKAVEIQPDSAACLSMMAWILGKHPSPKIRNLDKALEAAARAVEAAGPQELSSLMQMEVLFAENERWEGAAQAAKKALSFLPEGQPERQAIEARLADYRKKAGQPPI